jgi:hypothetical protein
MSYAPHVLDLKLKGLFQHKTLKVLFLLAHLLVHLDPSHFPLGKDFFNFRGV